MIPVQLFMVITYHILYILKVIFQFICIDILGGKLKVKLNVPTQFTISYTEVVIAQHV